MQTTTKRVLDRAVYSRLGIELRGSLIDATYDLLEGVTRDVILLAAGSPGLETYPVEDLREITDGLLREEGAGLLAYGSGEGDDELRSHIAREFQSLGASVDEDCVVITAGATHGLELLCKLTLDPGDVVIVDTPSFSNMLAQFMNYQAELAYVPLDEQGTDVEGVEREVQSAIRAGRKVKLIYTIPNFHNPAGLTIPLSRRKELLKLADRYGVVLVEDDPYGALRFEGDPLPPMVALDESGHAVYVGAFTKTVSPGLRVGWVVAPRDLAARMAFSRSTVDVSASTLGQRMVARFCSSGGHDRHVKWLRSIYRRKRDIMLEELEARFGSDPRVSWTRPEGGFFVWMTLEEEVIAEDLVRTAIQEGVVFIPGSAFDFRKQTSNQLRLCFAYPGEEQVREGIKRLKVALERYRAEGYRSCQV